MYVHAQLCSILLDPMGCNPTRLLHPQDFPGKNTAVAISSSRGSSPRRDRTHVSELAGRLFTTVPAGKPPA